MNSNPPVRKRGGDSAAWIVGLVVAGVVLRLLLLWMRWDSPFTGEANDYIQDATGLLGNPPAWVPRRPVGLPLAIAGILRIGDGRSSLVRLIPFLFGTANLAAAALLAWRCCRPWAAAATAWMAFSPAQIVDSTEPLSQAPVTLAALLILILLSPPERVVRRPGRNGLVIGLIAAAATLFRTSAAALIVLPWAARGGSPARRRAVFASSLFIAFVALFVARNSLVAGSPMAFNSLDAKNFFYGNNRYTPLYKTWVQGNRPEKATGSIEEREYLARYFVEGDPAASSRNYFRAAVGEILRHPELFLIRSLNRVRCWFGFDINAGAILLKSDGAPLPAAYLVIAWEAFLWTTAGVLASMTVVLGLGGDIPSIWKRCYLPAIAVLLLVLPYVVSFSHPTYHAPAAPLVMVLAAAGIAALTGDPALLRKRRGRLAIAGCVFLLVQVEWFLMMVDRI